MTELFSDITSDFVIGLESVIVYMTLLATVIFARGRSDVPRHPWRLILLSTLVFAAALSLWITYVPVIWTFSVFTLACAFLPCCLFLRSQLLIDLVTLVYLLYAVLSSKGIVSTLFGMLIPHDSTLRNIAIEGCMCAVYALLYLYFQRHPINPAPRMPRRLWLLLILAPTPLILNVQLIYTQYESDLGYIDLLPRFGALCSFLLLSHYACYLLVRSYESQIETDLISQRLRLQLSHSQHTASVIDAVRKERHELKNNYFYIQTLVKEQRYDELSGFIEHEMGRRLELTDEFNTGHRIVDYILTQKVAEARAEGIPTTASIMCPATISITEDDLCALLLNLLDNAIEASRQETRRDIRIHIGTAKRYLTIKVENLCSSDVLTRNPKLETIKQDAEHHGIGMKIIRQITQRYDGMFETYMDSGYFVATVMLPC